MSLTTIAADFKRMSGVTDDAAVLSTLNLAAHEIWESVDLPGELREVRLTTDAERYCTLPFDAHKIRGVRMVTGAVPMEVVPIGDRYVDGRRIQHHWTWRQLYRTPLQRRITNATRLTFTARKKLDARCTLTIGGPTSLGTRVYETLVIDTNQRAVTSEECYQDLIKLDKDVTTNSDIIVTAGDGTELSVLPNHADSASYWLVQIRESCASSSGTCAGCNCFDVLYKPALQPFTDLSAYWPPIGESVLLFKALEHFYLGREEMLAVAREYNGKAVAIMQQFQVDEAAGKTIRPRVTKSPFQTRTGAIL